MKRSPTREPDRERSVDMFARGFEQSKRVMNVKEITESKKRVCKGRKNRAQRQFDDRKGRGKTLYDSTAHESCEGQRCQWEVDNRERKRGNRLRINA